MIPSSKYHISEEAMEEERKLIEASKRDPAAFSPLYEKYYEDIFRYIYQRSDQKENAFDLTQQVFIKALLYLPGYTHKSVPFSSWLYRIAKSEVYQAFKDNSLSRTLNIDTYGLNELLKESDTDEFMLQKEKSLTHCLSILAESELQLVEMRFFESRAFKEIGAILNITENNAKVKIYRILDKLKKCILSN